MRGIIIGRSELDRIDREAGVARAAFRPGVGYDLVQPVFRLFTEATGTPAGGSGGSGEARPL